MSSPEAVGLPRLIVVTNDEIVARSDFLPQAGSIMEAGGSGVAVQLRANDTSSRALCELAGVLRESARTSGALLFVNERIDIALAVAADGVQLGRNAVPVAAARALLNERGDGGTQRRMWIGASVHSAAEGNQAVVDGADLLVLGTIWASASHPGRPGSGVARVAETAACVSVPVYAVGGVTPVRAREVLHSGGFGVAVITGVWDAADPAVAAASFLEAMQVSHD